MKLIKCHIENFGKISQFDYEFKDGLNELYYDNGWGKTTFAAFLKVMFFGFDNEKVNKDAQINRERNRYMPWQGGIYGGTVTFQTGSRQYTFTRQFAKKEAEDTFEIRDAITNMITDDFSSNIGMELFQIDKAAFVRTVFVSQNDCEAGMTDSIAAKIGNLAENTDDINNYESALKEIKNRLNELTPSRKTGELNRLKLEMGRYELMLSKRETLENDLLLLKKKISDIDRETEILQADRNKLEQENLNISKLKDIQVKAKEYEGIEKDYGEACLQCEERRKFFPGEVMSVDKVKELQNLSLEYDRISTSLKNTRVTPEETDRYEYLKDVFVMGIPDTAILEKYVSMAEQIAANEMEIAKHSLSDGDREILHRIECKYQNDVPDTGYMEELFNKELTLRQLEKAETDFKETNSFKKKSAVPYFSLVPVCIVIAVILFVNVGMWGCVMLLPAIAGLFFGFDALRKNRRADRCSNELKDILDQKDEILCDINASFARYNIVCTREQILDRIYAVKSDVESYSRIKSVDKESEIEDIGEKNNVLATDLKNFLMDYFTMEELNNRGYTAALGNLQRYADEYIRLRNDNDRRILAEKQLSDTRRGIDGILNAYGFESQGDFLELIKLIDKNLTILSMDEARFDGIRIRKKQFEAENDIDAIKAVQIRPEDDEAMSRNSEAVTELLARQNEIYRNRNLYMSQIDSRINELEDLEQAEGTLRDMKEKYSMLLKEYELLQKTNEYLAEAQAMFTSRYTAPVKERFDEYYGMISGNYEEIADYKLDARVNMTVEKDGLQRNTQLLSMGYRNMIGICMRMALVDVMYENEKPFMIFDDPFVNMDEGKIKGAGEFLKEICKSYQVVYFTCHSDRSI